MTKHLFFLATLFLLGFQSALHGQFLHAMPDNIVIDEDAAATCINLVTNDVHDNGQPIFLVTTAGQTPVPAHGTVSGLDGSGAFCYTPDPDFCGVDSAMYTAYALTPFEFGTAWIYITVNCILDLPQGQDDNFFVPELQTVFIDVLANDINPEPGSLTLTEIIGLPNKGVASISGGSIEFTQSHIDSCGLDTIYYSVCNAPGNCDTAALYLNIECPNYDPTAVDDNVNSVEDNSEVFAVLVNDIDPEGDPLSLVSLPCLPLNGSALISGFTIFYSSYADYCGLDSLCYVVCDTAAQCDTGKVVIDVTCVNDGPRATNDVFNTDENDPGLTYDVLLNDLDPEGDNFTLTQILIQPLNGTAYIDGTMIFYQPDTSFIGQDTLFYSICDAQNNCDTARVIFNLIDINFAPIGVVDFGTIDEDSPGAPFEVISNDIDLDGDLLTLAFVDASSYQGGTATISAGSLFYAPPANYCGWDTVRYTAADPSMSLGVSYLFIEINCTNDPPTAVDDSRTYPDSTTTAYIDVLTNDFDIDGDVLTAFLIPGPNLGTVSTDGNGIFYSPAPGFSGVDHVYYVACDPFSECDTAIISISILDLNYAPVVASETLVLTEDDVAQTIDVELNDQELDNEPIAYSILTVASNGTASIVSGGVIQYTPNPNYCGLDSVQYTACDPANQCNSTYAYFQINCVNDAPVAVYDSIPVAQNSVDNISNITMNDIEMDNDLLVVSILSSPTQGTAVYNGDYTVTYSPNQGFTGIDTMSYAICDPFGACDSTEIYFYVRGNIIVGKVFHDLDGNGIWSTGEPPIPNAIVCLYPGPVYTNTGADGFYSVEVDTGSYSVSVPNPPLYYNAVPDSFLFSYTNHGSIDSLNNFALQVVGAPQNLKVELNSSLNAAKTNVIYWITYTNLGTNVMDGSVELNYDARLNYANASPVPDIAVPEFLSWAFTGLEPLESRVVQAQFSLQNGLPWVTEITSSANILPLINDVSLFDNTDEDIIGLWSSAVNTEKTVSPEGNLTFIELLNQTPLTYTIHFQNTTGASISSLKITDSIDSNLNFITFVNNSSSHPYTYSITGNGVIEWHFENINLLPSSQNDLLSRGFISYQVTPRLNLQLGDIMTNDASIHFEGTAPFSTNEVVTVIDTATINGNQLIADFDAPFSICSEEVAYFTDMSSGQGINLWYWNFDDPASGFDSTSLDPSSTHEFSGAGSFDVTFYVSDGQTMSSASQSFVVEAYPSPTIQGPQFTDGVYDSYIYSTNFVQGNTYTWSVIDGSFLPGVNNGQIIVTWDSVLAGIICVTETNSLNCDSTHCRGINVTPPPVFVTDFSWPDTVCLSETIQFNNLTQGNNINWVWNFDDPGSGVNNSSNQTNPSHMFSSTGTFDVMLIGFTSQFTDTVIHQVQVFPAPSPFVSGQNLVCPNSCDYEYQAMGNVGTFHWVANGGSVVTGSGTNEIEVCWGNQTPSSLSLTQTNNFGCDFTITFNVNMYTVTIPTVVQNGNMVSTNAVASNFQWHFNGNPILGANSSTWQMTQFGSYSVVITDVNGCEVESDIVSYMVGVEPEISNNFGLKVFPNPFNEEFIIQYELKERASVEFDLYSVLGEKVASFTKENETIGQHSLDFNAFNIPAGVYLLNILVNGEGSSVKIVKH